MSAVRHHVCPTCGLAGPTDGPEWSYCRLHGVHKPDDLNRTAPPDLGALIREFDGYGNIAPEGWRRYREGIDAWRLERGLGAMNKLARDGPARRRPARLRRPRERPKPMTDGAAISGANVRHQPANGKSRSAP